MTDELTPEQEAAVRRLLAEARHDEPIPADVAARLDAALDGLATPATRSSGSVSHLVAARERRRNAGRLLLAAAAVVVAGVGIGQAIGPGGSSDDADQGAAGPDSAEDARKAPEPEVNPQENGDGSAYSAPATPGPTPGSLAYDQALADELDAPFTLSSGTFADDVRAELRAKTPERQEAADADLDAIGLPATAASGFVCRDADYGLGAKLPAYYDTEEAVLVLRPPRAGVQRVDLLECGTADRLNSVDLPAP